MKYFIQENQEIGWVFTDYKTNDKSSASYLLKALLSKNPASEYRIVTSK